MNGSDAPRPRRTGIPWSILVPAVGALAALWFLRTALAPFFIAIVLAYLLEPLTARFARRLPRGWAALLATLICLMVLGLLLWILVPPFVAQVERLVESLPAWREKAIARWTPWFNAHPAVQERLRRAVESLDPMDLLRGVQTAGLGLMGWMLEGLTLILVPLIVYYLLVEGPSLGRGLEELIPVRYRNPVRGLGGEINQRLGGYIRGQLAVMLVMSILQGLAFQLLGVPYPWVLGLLAGLATAVPYSPYVTALPLALLFSALDGAGGGHLLLAGLVFFGVQKLEAFYFTPVWVGRASGLHPLEVLLGLFCFGFAFGIVGLIFAVPLMVVFKTLSRFFLVRYKAHPWYVG
ncbi:MAG: AI-2E family transporter [Holophaga sp.]